MFSKTLLHSLPWEDRLLGNIFGKCHLDTPGPAAYSTYSIRFTWGMENFPGNFRWLEREREEERGDEVSASENWCCMHGNFFHKNRLHGHELFPFWRMVLCLVDPNLCSSFWSSFLLCLTLLKSKHTSKVCSDSPVFPCIAVQEPAPHTMFLKKQVFFVLFLFYFFF